MDGGPSLESPARECAAVVGLAFGIDRPVDVEHSLEELRGLAAAAGVTVVLQVLQERRRPDPALLLGRGKVAMLALACDEAGADLVIFNNELSPGQLRNLERTLDRRVLDRTQLILDIFASRARTREGKLQVELAQLKYLLPRLVGAGMALSRLGGGIGTRGPGETKLETDRRRIRRRIGTLGRALDIVRGRRTQARERRHKVSVPTVALVGYTNAGKTTVFNLLTRGGPQPSAAVFATLDPLVRPMKLPDARRLLVADTVGFIDRLPHDLVAAFRATLEEVIGADLLVHVIDVTSPAIDRQSAAVRRVLEEIGAGAVPRVDVLNKCDAADPSELARVWRRHPDAVQLSARTGQGKGALIDLVVSQLSLDVERVTLVFDDDSAADRRRITELYRSGRVLAHVTQCGRVSIEAHVPRRTLRRLQPYLIGNVGLRMGAE
ncbi:MAG TPA: GTPase HflX [Acidobacteria bacterium]|nr:GTPase HflX [Acidobacteriota bacterium]